MEHKRLKPWHGIVSFVVMMVIFLAIAFPIQTKFGLLGVGITELILLAMAIGATLIFKQNLKEVFPVRVPKIREVLGVFVFFLGGYISAIMASASLTVLFPEGMTEVSDGLNAVMTSEGMLLGILIVSIMPAICEEALHRGFILHTFKGVNKQWVVVLSMAVIFGVFHWDLYRFVPTAILGACMTWVMLKTENILMPSLYHATNNLFPVLIGFAMQGVTEAAMATADGQSVTTATMLWGSDWVMKLSSIGVYLMLTALAFPLMLAGTALLKKKGDKVKGKHVAMVFIITGALFVIGLIMIIGASMYLVMTQGIGM